MEILSHVSSYRLKSDLRKMSIKKGREENEKHGEGGQGGGYDEGHLREFHKIYNSYRRHANI